MSMVSPGSEERYPPEYLTLLLERVVCIDFGIGGWGGWGLETRWPLSRRWFN